jgi:hypothetical protein
MAASSLVELKAVSTRNDKIHCANCSHCKIIKVYTSQSRKQYVLRVRCEKKLWKKKLGEEKLYKYFTVARRTMDSCSDYAPMGDARVYLKELRKTLPIKDEVYREEGQPDMNAPVATNGRGDI